MKNAIKNNDFDIYEAYTCLQLCQISYLLLDTQKKNLKKLKFKKFKEFQKENSYAFSCVKDGILYLVFRGSDFSKIGDISDDLDIKKTKEGIGEVHAGYKKHLDRIWKDIRNYISKQKYKKIIITGHSMGAACGQIINYRLSNTVGYYFGSARSVDSKIYRDKNYCVFHIQNEYDLVTNFPPKFIFDFRLIGTKFVLKYGELYERQQTSKEIFYTVFYMFLFLIVKLISIIFGLNNKMSNLLLKNHKIADYHKNLRAYIKRNN
jgi:hypothetical protein